MTCLVVLTNFNFEYLQMTLTYFILIHLIDEVESVMNIEIEKLFHYCATNKLSVDLKKTNFMLITNSNQKLEIYRLKILKNVILSNILVFTLIRILIGTIKHVNNEIAENTGIINKLRYYLDLKTLEQLYYTLIYPYLSYGLMS